MTGNATSQSYLAFFYATGYADVVPTDQTKALLYYTFAAQGGDKGAQMALAYRYWSGIGTLEDCPRALGWYEEAADQGILSNMQKSRGNLTCVSCSNGEDALWSAGWAIFALHSHQPF